MWQNGTPKTFHGHKRRKCEEMPVIGIETSCDETAAAVVYGERAVLSNVVISQIDVHKEFGGVVPEIASRKHVQAISMVIEKALRDSKVSYHDIEGVAVTRGPGLAGALMVVLW